MVTATNWLTLQQNSCNLILLIKNVLFASKKLNTFWIFKWQPPGFRATCGLVFPTLFFCFCLPVRNTEILQTHSYFFNSIFRTPSYSFLPCPALSPCLRVMILWLVYMAVPPSSTPSRISGIQGLRQGQLISDLRSQASKLVSFLKSLLLFFIKC